MREVLEFLVKSRDLLDKGHIQHKSRDGHGGYCAYGAMMEVGGYFTHNSWPNAATVTVFVEANRLLKIAVLDLYPHTRRWRLDITDGDIIEINDSSGKAAILAVFDTAIAKLQAELAVPVPADWGAVEKETAKDLVAAV